MSACAVIFIIFVLRNTSRTIHTRVTGARSLIFQQIIRNTNQQLLNEAEQDVKTYARRSRRASLDNILQELHNSSRKPKTDSITVLLFIQIISTSVLVDFLQNVGLFLGTGSGQEQNDDLSCRYSGLKRSMASIEQSVLRILAFFLV